MGRIAKGACEVEDDVPLFQSSEVFGRFTDFLKNNGDRSVFGIRIGDGQGDSFTVFIDAQNDELPGLPVAGDLRRIDFELLDIRSQNPLEGDFVELHSRKFRRDFICVVDFVSVDG